MSHMSVTPFPVWQVVMGCACCKGDDDNVSSDPARRHRDPILIAPVPLTFLPTHHRTHQTPVVPPASEDRKAIGYSLGYDHGGLPSTVNKNGEFVLGPTIATLPAAPTIAPSTALWDTPTSADTTIVRASVNGTWSTVDDRRRLLSEYIKQTVTEFTPTSMDDLLFLTVEYVGCLVCPDKESRTYRSTKLIHSTCHKLINTCDHHPLRRQVLNVGMDPPPSQPMTATGSTTTLPTIVAAMLPNIPTQSTQSSSTPNQHWCLRLSGRVMEGECLQHLLTECWSKFKGKPPRSYCRYCGLSLYHHVGNRQFVPPTEKDNHGILWNPQQYYCDLRCPIHNCISCRDPFVKVAETHMCACCLDKEKQKPAARRAWRSIEQVNRYEDEIVRHWKAPMTIIDIPHVTTGKHGTHTVMKREERVDRAAAVPRVRSFLDTLEYACVLCNQRFRLTHFLPAELPTVVPTSTAPATTEAVSLSTTVAMTTTDISSKRIICGFCQL